MANATPLQKQVSISKKGKNKCQETNSNEQSSTDDFFPPELVQIDWPDCGLVTGNKNFVSHTGEYIFRMLGFQQAETTDSSTSSKSSDMVHQRHLSV